MEIQGFGVVHCGGCDKPIGYFPPDVVVPENELELYCLPCAEEIAKGQKN